MDVPVCKSTTYLLVLVGHFLCFDWPFFYTIELAVLSVLVGLSSLYFNWPFSVFQLAFLLSVLVGYSLCFGWPFSLI